MRVLKGVLACALVVAFARDAAPASTFAPLTGAEVRAIMNAPDRHIRAVDAGMTKAIANGMRRSGTFAHLVLALNKSDVIVYIETGHVLPSTIVGRLLLAAGPEGTRYLRIQVSGHPGSNDMIALVGHEPGIGELGARLIGSRHSFEFKKGAVCRIDVDEIPPVGPGDLRWFLTPKVMASIKKK